MGSEITQRRMARSVAGIDCLKSRSPFKQTSMADVAGSLPYSFEPKTVAQMYEAIARSVKARQS